MHKLAGVHPELSEKVMRILAAMEVLGFQMMVTDGVRTTGQQQTLYAKGRTIKGEPPYTSARPLGRTVTQADGIVKKSNHQPKSDGLGRAVDCCFLVDDIPSWLESHPWHLYGAMAQALGLTWGGAWVNFKDKPHVEMT